MRARPCLFVTALAIASALARSASAGDGASDEARLRSARDLFVDAEKDEDAGRWSDALEKLRRVFAVKQTAGVRSHIALCEEHLAQLVAALRDYTDALSQAQSENAQDVLQFVGRRLTDLGPRVPRLTVHLVPDVPDATVTLDSDAIAPALLGTAIPVEVGSHRIEASTSSHPVSTVVVVVRERDAVTVDVKLADPAPAPAPPPAPRAVESPSTPPVVDAPPSRSSPAPAVVATVVAGVLAAGGVLAFSAAGGAHASAVDSCRATTSGAGGACDSQKETVRAWDWTAAGAWLGAAAAATVAVVLWTHRAAGPAGGSTSLVTGGGSLGVRGEF